jgi:hypothetical protein
LKVYDFVDIGIWLLFMGKDYVAANAHAAGFPGASVRCFHDPGTAAGDHGESGSRQFTSDLDGNTVVVASFPEPCGPEHRYGRTEPVQPFEPGRELVRNAFKPLLLSFRRAGGPQKFPLPVCAAALFRRNQLVCRGPFRFPARLPRALPPLELESAGPL